MKLKNDQNEYLNILNGTYTPAQSKKTIALFSPSTFEYIGSIPSFDKVDVDAAIQATKEHMTAWVKMPVYERANIFYKAADLLEKRADIIADVMMKEIAKDRKSARTEVMRSADFLRHTADVGKNIEGAAISGDQFPGGSRNKMSYVSRVPLGTVLAIAPFNYPVNLSLSKIAPALIAGNAVVLKPPTQGAMSALEMADVFAEAGLPAGILNTITGRGSDIGDYALQHPGINFINFTGSTAVGKHIASIAKMVPLLLELGGKDAAIVLPDADLAFAGENITAGAYSYSGQRCTAVKRILVDESVADALIADLTVRIGKLQVGMPESGATIVPLIDTAAADFVQTLINDAIEKGARLVMGNRREGNLLYPTLLDNVTPDMRIAWEEPFGPVLPILRVKSVEEAIAIANQSEYGLQSSVFTSDIDKAFHIADALEVGTVQINNKTERGPDHFPFLGVKASGMGTQGVKYSIEAMSRPKAVVVTIRSKS